MDRSNGAQLDSTNSDTDIVQAFKFCFLTLRILSGLSLKTWMYTQGVM